MFIGPCIIAIVDEWKTNLMSLAILFHLLCPQHVSDINISIFRSLRLCWWITTSVVLFSVRCVLELLLRLLFGGVRFAGFSLQHGHHPKPATPNLQHAMNWEQDDRCGNSTTRSQAPDDWYINTRHTGDADLCLYITTVQDGWRKSAFLTSAWFPRTIHSA